MEKDRSLFASLFESVADAVADIREKVVEEPMWGRAVNERESNGPQWPQASEEQAFGSLERNIERTPDLDIER
jgi:hypothetical protein